jgi:hypothetical protein
MAEAAFAPLKAGAFFLLNLHAAGIQDLVLMKSRIKPIARLPAPS